MTVVTVGEGGPGQGFVGECGGDPVLVVGVDGSPASWDAFLWAADQARRAHGRMIVVFAMPLVDRELAMAFNVPLDYGEVEVARSEMAAKLAAEVARRADELGVEASFVAEYGDAAQALARVAGSTHAGTIAVGRSERTFHRLAGSLDRGLVLSPQSPVVVVVP